MLCSKMNEIFFSYDPLLKNVEFPFFVIFSQKSIVWTICWPVNNVRSKCMLHKNVHDKKVHKKMTRQYDLKVIRRSN